MTRALNLPQGLDTTKPTPARIHHYMLRGQHYFDPDAKVAERLLGILPELRDTAWANRGFHQRSAAWIAHQGIRQFLDIGAGLPTAGNTHEVVQRIHPDARVIYASPDPMIETCQEEVADLRETVGVLCADLREPAAILDHPRVRELIDPRQPTGLLMNGTVALIADEDGPFDLVATYVRHQAPGSYLTLSHLTHDAKPPAKVAECRSAFDSAAERPHFRSRPEVARFFDGLDLIPPYGGARPEITYCGIWGAEDVTLADSEGSRWMYCGVARIP